MEAVVQEIRRGRGNINPDQIKNQGPVDANEIYEVVMSTEGFAEEMLASAFDYMIQEEKVDRAFMAKAPKLRKLWLENYFTKNM